MGNIAHHAIGHFVCHVTTALLVFVFHVIKKFKRYEKEKERERKI